MYYKYTVRIEGVGLEYHCFDNDNQLERHLNRKYPGVSFEIVEKEKINL